MKAYINMILNISLSIVDPADHILMPKDIVYPLY